MIRIGNSNADHLYEVEVVKGTQRSKIEVSANTRGQASKLAKTHGYIVRSVNLIG